MIPAALPIDEADRLASLARYEILDTGPEEAFDRLTRLASHLLGAPIALVSLLDETRQWFKARVGLDASETPRPWAFCGHAILQAEPFVVMDAASDERFVDNPLVTGDPRIRFYAGAPLTTSDGQRLGTLCVIDRVPRPALDEPQRQVLKDLAALVVDEMELRLAGRLARREAEHRRVLHDRIAAAYRSKSEFLASLSHELRTPLNGIIGFSDIMEHGREGDLSPQYREYAQIVRSSGEHMLALVNDILDFSKAEAGRLDLQVQKVKFAGLAEDCLRLVAQFARKREVVTKLDLADATLAFEADKRRLKQVLLNLLTNAIKFTPAGGTVTLFAARQDEQVVLKVADTGVGIAAGDIEKVMAPFGQVAGTAQGEGTGLGLPITKALVERHGGTLRIDSEPGKGTTVTVTLPLEQGE